MLDEIETHKDKSGSSKYSKSSSGTKEDLAISVKDLTVKWDPVSLKQPHAQQFFS